MDGWAYILVKGDIDEAFDSAADYHTRLFGCRTPAEMVAAIERVKSSGEMLYVLEEDGADTVDNFLSRFKEEKI